MLMMPGAAWLITPAAFGGAMLIIKPGFSADAFPAVIGLLGGMGAGAAYTFVRALSKRKEKSARIVFFFSAFSTLTALPFVIADFHPMTFAQFMCLMGAGAAATLGQFGVTLAYLHAPAQLKRDLAQARWKPAFLQRLFGVPLPYGKVYAALKHKK